MAKRFNIEILNQDKLIKDNDLSEVTNPALFGIGGPTPDGLLSNDIFGITKAERSGIPAYIGLQEYFIQPYFYKIWLRIDKNLKACIYETDNFKINKDGFLEKDDNGDTGIKFLRKNIDKIKFKESKKELFLEALNKAKKDGILFTNKFAVTPPFYRDVNTQDGKAGVGEINKMYIALINAVKGLKETTDYGLDLAGGTRGRIQDIMLDIYNWFTVGLSPTGDDGNGIFKKMGAMRRSVMSKTVDYSTRLIITSQKLDVNTKEELQVDVEHSAVPLASALANLYPFILYELRQFFTNEFGGKTVYPCIDSKTGGVVMKELKDARIEFSDDRLDKEINEFIHGYSDRFKKVPIPLVDNKRPSYWMFKGYSITPEEYANGVRESENIITRPGTWVDLFYIAACAAAKDKTVVISRYPIDSYFNQLYNKIRISSTNETECLVVNGELYKWYPKIRVEDIGSDTSNKFVDSLNMCNLHCAGMGADFDGDMISSKAPWTIEANEEVEKYMNSNAQYITLGGTNIKTTHMEGIQAMYNLTLVLSTTKLTDPKF